MIFKLRLKASISSDLSRRIKSKKMSRKTSYYNVVKSFGVMRQYFSPSLAKLSQVAII